MTEPTPNDLIRAAARRSTFQPRRGEHIDSAIRRQAAGLRGVTLEPPPDSPLAPDAEEPK